MNYNELLKELVTRVDFNKYDAFSTSKYCHFIEYKGKELAFIWQHQDNPKLLIQTKEEIEKLKNEVDKAKQKGARLPSILSVTTNGEYIFQLQERVHGKKVGYYEILANKTEVSEMIELLKTLDVMNECGIAIDQGYNCLVDDDGKINLFDTYIAKKSNKKINSKPWFFSQFILREPQYLSEEDIVLLKKIIKKWIKACTIYFIENNLENIREEIYSTIKDITFISTEEKYQLIDEELSLQKGK